MRSSRDTLCTLQAITIWIYYQGKEVEDWKAALLTPWSYVHSILKKFTYCCELQSWWQMTVPREFVITASVADGALPEQFRATFHVYLKGMRKTKCKALDKDKPCDKSYLRFSYCFFGFVSSWNEYSWCYLAHLVLWYGHLISAKLNTQG